MNKMAIAVAAILIVVVAGQYGFHPTQLTQPIAWGAQDAQISGGDADKPALEITPPEPDYALNIEPFVPPQSVVHVGHYARHVTMDEDARTFVTALSWSSLPGVYKPDTVRCSVARFERATGKKLWETPTYEDTNWPGLVVDSEEGLFASALHHTGRLVVGNLETGEVTSIASLEPYFPRCTARGQDDSILIGAEYREAPGGQAVLLAYDWKQGERVVERRLDYVFVNKMCMVPGSETLALALNYRQNPRKIDGAHFMLMDAAELNNGQELPLEGRSIRAFTFDRTGKNVFLGRENNGPKIPASIEAVALEANHMHYRISEPLRAPWLDGQKRGNFLPHTLQCSPDGQYLLYGGEGPIRIYNAHTGELLSRLRVDFIRRNPYLNSRLQYQDASQAWFDPTGKWIAAYCGGNVFFWETETLLKDAAVSDQPVVAASKATE